MKKWLILLALVVCLTAVMAGCGKQDAADGDTAPTTTQNPNVPTKAKFISEDEAMAKAATHWNIRPGDRDPDNGYVFSLMTVETPTNDQPTYRVILRWLVEEEGEPSHYSTVDTVQIDAVTGEVQSET